MRKAVLASGLAAALMIIAGPASAQYQMVSPMLYHGPAISFRDHVNKTRPADNATPQARRSVGNAAAANTAASLSYRPDMARRRTNLAQFVEKVRPLDPQGAANLAGLFAQGDFLEKLQTDLRPYGLRIDNVADAFATYWISAHQASRGDSSTPPRATFDAVKAQAAQVLGGTPELARAGDAAKQEIAESIWIQMALLESVAEGAKADPKQQPVVRQVATQGALAMGLDLSRLTLTGQGFVAKP